MMDPCERWLEERCPENQYCPEAHYMSMQFRVDHRRWTTDEVLCLFRSNLVAQLHSTERDPVDDKKMFIYVVVYEVAEIRRIIHEVDQKYDSREISVNIPSRVTCLNPLKANKEDPDPLTSILTGDSTKKAFESIENMKQELRRERISRSSLKRELLRLQEYIENIRDEQASSTLDDLCKAI